MRTPSPKSCYILELSVLPGGSRRAELYAYSSLEKIKIILTKEFLAKDPQKRADAAFYALFYGETLMIWLVQEGKVVKGIDLHPFIWVQFQGKPKINLADNKSLASVLSEYLPTDDYPDGNQFVFSMDWDRLISLIEPLQGTKLQPKQKTFLEISPEMIKNSSTYLKFAYASEQDEEKNQKSIYYGVCDLEWGL